MKKIYIGTAKEIGLRCIEWAKKNTPKGFKLTNSIEECDIFISVLYDKILNKNFLTQRPCHNFHPATLPEYRGVGAYSWVFINEEDKTGITLHLIDEGIDTGDIIEIREFLISPSDTAYTLHSRGAEIIYKMFKDWYHDILNQNFTAIKQTKKYKMYNQKDLENAKNITKYIKAFHFPGKESMYYINKDGNKIFIDLEQSYKDIR